MRDGGHVANAPLPTLLILNSLSFSIRARFDNFMCDAVHSAVKLRSARFDTACACTGCSDFVCARSAENMPARFFRKSHASHVKPSASDANGAHHEDDRLDPVCRSAHAV